MPRSGRSKLVRWFSVAVVLTAAAGGISCSSDGDGEAGASAAVNETSSCLCSGWEDHPASPMIEPGTGEWLLGDPTVARPEETPDGLWHLFANNHAGILHWTSQDGLDWTRETGNEMWPGMRTYLYREDGLFYLFNEFFEGFFGSSRIVVRTSEDLYNWSASETVLTPTLDWEQGDNQAVTGNPFLMKRDGQYWLYYSANSIVIEETQYFEPKYIGLARADSILGPYEKEPDPIISPDENDPWRNHGTGSMKVYDETWNGRLLGFNNGIYIDDDGMSRSAILVIASDDGVSWEDVCAAPIIAPEPGWKEAFVYAFDVKRVGNEFWMYYNARDGYQEGKERIGLAVHAAPDNLDEMEACE